MPLKWLDVMRFTSTSLPEAGMRSIDDYWLEDKDESLDMEWTGHTRFSILKPQARMHYEWVSGRESKTQKNHKTRQLLAIIVAADDC